MLFFLRKFGSGGGFRGVFVNRMGFCIFSMGGMYDRNLHLVSLNWDTQFGDGRLRRVRFQTPSSVSFLALTEFRGESQRVPLSLLFVCPSELTEIVAELTEFGAELSELSLPKLERGEKTPYPKNSALLRRRPVSLRANFVFAKDRKRPYYGHFCGKIHTEKSCSKVAGGPSSSPAAESHLGGGGFFSLLPRNSTLETVPSQPKLLQKTSLQKELLDTINFVIATKHSAFS